MAENPSSAPTTKRLSSCDSSNCASNDCAEQIAALTAVAEDLQKQNNDLAKDRDLADRECRKLRKEADLLRRELAQAHEDDPKSKIVREILEHWKDKTGHGRALVPIDGKRADVVRRAMRWGFKPGKLKQAIEGAGKFPYVVDFKRSPVGPPGEPRRDDLDNILKSERQIELLAGLADVEPQPAATRPRIASVPRRPLDIDEFLGLLHGVKTAGLNQWNARCPTHEDRHASMSVSLGDKGIVAHCHAGCAIEDIAHTVGHDVADLFSDDEPLAMPSARAKADLEPLALDGQVAEWSTRLAEHPRLLGRILELRGWSPETLKALEVGYDGERLTLPIRDRDGRLQNVLRYLPVRKGDERKLLAMKGRPRDLFPAPETLTGDEWWLFEGEPDAITAHELGLQATTLPGVNGWRVEWARRFADCRVVVCLDCDEQGRKAAHRVLPSLLEHAKEVRLVDLDPGRDDGFDVSDFVKAGGTVGDLLRLALGAGAVVRMGDVAA